MNGDTVNLAQAQKVSLALGVSSALPGAINYKLVGGALPSGLSLSSGYVKGVPSKPGEYIASFQASGLGRSAATVTLKFLVRSAGVAIGTFNGLVARTAEKNNVARLGSVTATITGDGRIAATTIVGQNRWMFSGTGFDEYHADDEAPTFSTILYSISGSQTNSLAMVIPAGDTNSLAAISSAANFDFDAAGNTETARGFAYRAASDLVIGNDAVKAFAGYYTIALPVRASEFGEPNGAGYVTATIDGSGSTRMTGVLGDGTQLTLSTAAALLDSSTDAIVLPVYSGATTRSFGGYLVLRKQGDVVVVDADYTLEWNESDAKKTYSAQEGFSHSLAAVGGEYSTLLNLQTYYLDREVLFDASSLASALPDEVYPAGYDFLILYPGKESDRVGASFLGNKVSLSGNDSKTTMSFMQNTGIFSGTFSLCFGSDAEGSKRREVSNIRYGGVFVPIKDTRETSFNVYPGMGYATLSVNASGVYWTGSWFIGLIENDITEENEANRRNEGGIFNE